MKIIFAPSNLGGGLGHVSRCEALAEYAKKLGHTYAFLLENPKIVQHVIPKHPIIRIPDSKHISNIIYKAIYSGIKRFQKEPLFVKISDLSYQVLRDGLVNEEIIRKKIVAYIKILEKEKPDILVGDTNLIIGIVARVLGIPLIQIVRKGFYPHDPQLIWWHPSGPDISPPKVCDMFNIVLNEFNIPPISKVEDLLNGDFYVIPSLPELEPVNISDNTFYIGPLLKEVQNKTKFGTIENTKNPLIYITIGGGAGNVGTEKFFKTIKNAFQNKKYQVIVSTTEKYYSGKLRDSVGNVQFHSWVPGRHLINKAELVIFHGGYGTMMEIIDAGVPSIVIPFHSEQESNGRRLRQQGCAELMYLSKQDEIVIQKQWRQTTYSYACQMDYSLSAEELYDSAKQVLAHQAYKKAVVSLQKKSQRFQAAKKFFELVNSKLGVI